MIGYVLVLFDFGYCFYLIFFDMVFILVFFIVGIYVVQVIVISGVEVLDDFKDSMLVKQELIVWNVIMIKQFKIDGFINLYNQSLFKDYYDKVYEYVKSGMSLYLVFIDIDDFKLINDIYGYWVGDIILEKVLYVIQENIILSDIVVCYGGEEFVLFMFEQFFDQVYVFVEQICQKIVLMGYLELGGNFIIVSVGFKSFNVWLIKEKLFEEVDVCLYVVKWIGKNKIVIFFDLVEVQ